MKLQFQNVSIQREKNESINVLHNLNLELDFNISKRIAVLGANGAGKSTLLWALLSLIPVSSGIISLDGVSLSKIRKNELRRRIGIVFQDAENQLFSQTVFDDVSFGPSNMGLDDAEIKHRVEQSMKILNIEHLKMRNIVALSGGEKRRVALAGVLAMQPELILLDEPTAMLDPRGVRELIAYLSQLSSAIMVATHDFSFANALCDYCILLNQGEIITFAPCKKVLQNESLLMECGLL